MDGNEMNNDRRRNSILIVDDESANIIALTNILSNDYRVYASSDGQDAIEVANKYMPDIVLLDVLMPEMDGYDVIAQLKRSGKTHSIPVIFITGLDNKIAEEKGLTLGAADYISKPFSAGIVKLRVQSQMKIVNHTSGRCGLYIKTIQRRNRKIKGSEPDENRQPYARA